jgi:hypothetical protein
MFTRAIHLLIVPLLLAGCAVSTERFAPEYSPTYVLASDTRVWTDCSLFTGWYSLNIGGPEKVFCFVSEYYNSPPVLSAQKIESDKKRMITLRKGSLVRIKRIFTTVHDGMSSAEMLITDSDSDLTKQVFAEYWPNNHPNLLSTR